MTKLGDLSNDELLARLRAHIGRGNVWLVGLLAYLAEVDARRLYAESEVRTRSGPHAPSQPDGRPGEDLRGVARPPPHEAGEGAAWQDDSLQGEDALRDDERAGRGGSSAVEEAGAARPRPAGGPARGLGSGRRTVLPCRRGGQSVPGSGIPRAGPRRGEGPRGQRRRGEYPTAMSGSQSSTCRGGLRSRVHKGADPLATTKVRPGCPGTTAERSARPGTTAERCGRPGTTAERPARPGTTAERCGRPGAVVRDRCGRPGAVVRDRRGAQAPSFETAARGLRSLGFREPEVRQVIARLATSLDPGTSVATIIRDALRLLT